jgi:hypothetical protein
MYCVYPDMPQSVVNQYVNDLQTWAQSYATIATPFPAAPNTSNITATCVEPTCAGPHEFRGWLSTVGFGDFGYYGGAYDGGQTETFLGVTTSFCGAPGAPEVDGYGSGYTQCEGFLPFQPLDWVSYECAGYETCSNEVDWYYGIAGAVPFRQGTCQSECSPGEVRCAMDGGIPQQDSTQVCTDEGVWGPAEQCPTDPEYGYEYICRNTTNHQGGITATCLDPVCAYWLDYYDTMSVPEGYGACTPEGQYRGCDAMGVLTDPVDCDGFCDDTSWNNGSVGEYYNTADQDPGACAVECEDGQERCLQEETSESPLFVTCEGGTWTTTPEACADNAVCYDGDRYDLQYYGTGYYFYQAPVEGPVICGGECTPGTMVCIDLNLGDGSQTMTCGDDGQWEDPVSCEMGYCEENGGFAQCEMECIPGTISCNPTGGEGGDGGGNEYLCLENGVWDDGTACDVSTLNFEEYCRVDNQGIALGCVQCLGTDTNGNAFDVADSECFSATETRSCNASNEWETEDACPGTDICNSQSNGMSTVAWCTPVPAP